MRFALWHDNPLMVLLVFFCFGILLSFIFVFSFLLLLGIALSLIVVSTILHRRNYSIILPLLITFALCGTMCGSLSIPKWYREVQVPFAEQPVSGEIIAIESIGDKSAHFVLDDVTRNRGEQMEGRVLLTVFGAQGSHLAQEYPIGTVLSMTTALDISPVQQQYGWYNAPLQHMKKGIRYTCALHYSGIQTEVEGDNPPEPPVIHKFRQSLRDTIYEYVGGQEGALLLALLTADKSGLAYESKAPFYDLGLAHILATSGLHIGVLLLCWEWIARRARVGFVPRVIVSALLVGVFILVAGLRSSLARAAIMWAAVIAARLLGRESDSMNALALAAFIMLVVNPLLIFDTGFLLSVTAVLAILLLYEPLNQSFGGFGEKKWFAPLVVSFAVYLLGWPVMMYYFNKMSVLAPLWNVIFVPLMTALLALGFLFMVTSWIPICALLLGKIIKNFAAVILWSTKTLKGVSVNLLLPSPKLWVISISLLGVLMLSSKFISGRKRMRIPIAIAMILSAIIVLICDTTPQDEIMAYSGMGTTALYISSSGENAIVTNEANAGLKTVLDKKGQRRLDKVIFSGNQADELKDLMTYLSDYDYTLYVHQELAPLLDRETQQDIVAMDEGEDISLGDVTIRLRTFKAKSKNSKHHYAAELEAWDQCILYFDPLRLREGAFRPVDMVVASRWSASRLDHIFAIDTALLIIDEASVLGYDSMEALDKQGMTYYNISRDGAVTIMPNKISFYKVTEVYGRQ